MVESVSREQLEGDATEEVWEPDDLMEMVSHDLINQQQAAMGFLELLEESKGLSEGERVLVTRTVEALEHTARLILQVRASLVQREWGEYRPVRVSLDRAIAASCRTVQGAFARDRLDIELKGLGGSTEVMADGMLSDMLTQLMLMVAEPAPPDRPCKLMVRVEPQGEFTAVRFMSEGFALNPMVTDALIGGRDPKGRTRDAATIALVRRMLVRYGGRAFMEPVPPGGVGAHLVIELPKGSDTAAVDHDS